MSGPPPWTTIGFSPTYFSSTTSRAKSSRSSGSVIAAPPYLMTTVLAVELPDVRERLEQGADVVRAHVV